MALGVTEAELKKGQGGRGWGGGGVAEGGEDGVAEGGGRRGDGKGRGAEHDKTLSIPGR